MREILFRGKRLDNGEWIDGHLIQYEDGRARICESNTEIFCYEKDHSIIQTVAHEVDPSTVVQYTGLKDKNGKRIFENGYMIIDKQTYKVLFDNGEYILKNIFNCDIIQLKNNSNIGVFVDEI